MDLLKLAVATAISKSSNFPAIIGDKVDIENSIWILNNGIKRDDGSNCSIFSFDLSAKKSLAPLAKNSVRKLRTLRHPGIIKVLDTVETDTAVYVITERVVPLRWHVKRKSMSPETLKWGLFSVAKAITFINDEASSVHGSLKASNIYTSESGEWKVGGFEVLTNIKGDETTIYTYGSLVPYSSRYCPPEVANSHWEVIKRNPISAVDAYNLGILIFEVFNGDFMGTDQVGQTRNIPRSMQSTYKRLVIANPRTRLSVSDFLEHGQQEGGFFETPLIKLSEGVDSLVMTASERQKFLLEQIDHLSDDFPEDYFRMKILPELLKSVEFDGGGREVFAVVMKIAKTLTDEDFEGKVTPVIVRLFSNPDRAIRVCLLDNLPLMIDRLPQKIVNDKIFPLMVTGFTDVAPVMREHTVKSILTVISKLSDRTTNGELLKYLAKTANDEQPGIRTNTTICLGKIARNLGVGTRSKVLVAAFSRSLRDPFIHARNAALMALAATVEIFNEDDSANRIMPAICPLLLDKEKVVRDQANKVLDLYLAKVRKSVLCVADTGLGSPSTAESSTTAGPPIGTLLPKEAASWAGWAISSFTNKISAAAGEIQSTTNGGPQNLEVRSNLAPQPGDLGPSHLTTTPASAIHRQIVASPSGASPRMSAASSPSGYFQDIEIEANELDGWGDLEDDNPFNVTSEKPKSKPTVVYPDAPFDDNGEPDFAGWLAAQAGKRPGAKPLPKGLAKQTPTSSTATSNDHPRQSKTTPTAGILSKAGTKKTAVVALKPKIATSKTIDTTPKDIGDDDNWGDGW